MKILSYSCMNLEWFCKYVTMTTWKLNPVKNDVLWQEYKQNLTELSRGPVCSRAVPLSSSSVPCWSLSYSLYFGSKPFVCFCWSSTLIRPWCRLATWLIKDAVTLHRNDAVSHAEVSTACRNLSSKSGRRRPECKAHSVLRCRTTAAAEFRSVQTSASPGRRAAERPARKKTFWSGYKTQSQWGKTEAAVKVCWAAVMIRVDHGSQPPDTLTPGESGPGRSGFIASGFWLVCQQQTSIKLRWRFGLDGSRCKRKLNPLLLLEISAVCSEGARQRPLECFRTDDTQEPLQLSDTQVFDYFKASPLVTHPCRRLTSPRWNVPVWSPCFNTSELIWFEHEIEFGVNSSCEDSAPLTKPAASTPDTCELQQCEEELCGAEDSPEVRK